MERFTKIVATIGPASQDEAVLRQLILAGMNVARLNFSHGSYEYHAALFNKIRKLSTELNRPISILQDLQGPKIRTGNLKEGSVQLNPGQIFFLTTEPVPGDETQVSFDFPALLKSVRPGSKILLDDGNLELAVLNVNQIFVETKVVIGGILKPHKGINLPGLPLDIPGFTEKDEQDLAFGIELGIDVVAISFVRSAGDIQLVRQAILKYCPEKNVRPPIIAKLERPEALENLEEIILAADGVMVARGDLGVEMPPEAVPIAQKRIISMANHYGRIVITATQMLDSMIQNPRPTRAEASDVANAIFDGTDAVMLSGETAAGKYPIQSVRMMNAIACQVEPHILDWGHHQELILAENEQVDTLFITRAARELAHDRNVAAIAVFTKSGKTALMVSKIRPAVPIMAFTTELKTFQRLGIYWGVRPHLVPQSDTLESMIQIVDEVILSESPLNPGQQVVLICGFPIHEIRPTNLALLHTVGE